MNVGSYQIISGLIDGITIGSVYALMALGLSFVFGVTRAFNFGHGSFFTWARISRGCCRI
jgi:branched-chain amino acid transport system permease protein